MTKRRTFALRSTAPGLTALGSLALALPAAAAEVSPATGSGLITGLIVALAAAGVALLLAAALYWRERRRTDREQTARRLIDDELTALLNALPGGAMV